MSGVNLVVLVGRVGKEPETKYMQNGDAVTTLSLATSETWKDKDGEKQEKTQWHNLVFYRRLAEVVGEYVQKGTQLYIEGKLNTRKWQTKEGQDRYTTEIIGEKMQMLGGKNSSTEGRGDNSHPSQTRPTTQENTFDDDIPY